MPLRGIKHRYGGLSKRSFAGPRANRREINVRRLAQITKANEVVVVPRKSSRNWKSWPQLTVCAFNIRNRCKENHESGARW